ncbi:MAG: ATP-binding protein [Actinobacteria bacterium]|nr:MAG: ATP-binding protein [Actinomycetota bacterium]
MAVRESGMRNLKKCKHRVHELVMPNVSDSLHDIRAFTSESIKGLPFSKAAEWDIVLAVGEAATNCVEHGQSVAGVHNVIRTRILVQNDGIKIELHDSGHHFNPDVKKWPPPDLTSEKGRGIFIIKSLMDGVEYPPVDNGTLCVLTKKFDCGG